MTPFSLDDIRIHFSLSSGSIQILREAVIFNKSKGSDKSAIFKTACADCLIMLLLLLIEDVGSSVQNSATSSSSSSSSSCFPVGVSYMKFAGPAS